MDPSWAIDALKDAIPDGQFFFRGTAEYRDRNSSYLSQLESDLKPACIFQPRPLQNVVAFVRTIQPFAYKGEAQFAVRGGGQKPTPGCANIQDGITVDLANLAGIEIKKDQSLIEIGAGARWGAVYDKLDGSGIGVAGGRANNCGIGGLSLEGGLSFFSSREGFVCDNVVNYEIVLASGEVVNANAKQHPDLWRALRGGGNNFGIVTRYDFKTFPQGSIWGGNIYYFLPSIPSQIENLVNELNRSNPSHETHLMVSIGYAGALSPDPVGLNTVYFTQDVENPPELTPFVSVQPQIEQYSSVRIMTLKEAATDQAAGVSIGTRCAYMNITVKSNAAALIAASEIYKEALEPVKSVEGLRCSFTLQPYPASLLEKSFQNGGNCLGLEATLKPLVSVLLLSYWQNVGDDGKILEMMGNALEKIKSEAASREQLVPYVYMNYAFDNQDPVGSYGEDSKRLLMAVSKKYDPEGLFQKGCPGGFKLHY
ncbi:FAD-binding domain-containing protein [Annulohypoxylon maeteangense]|uniref:FAD-binding domain-containing protein n=1 Tax=Annulohypoxylon maeteangense TaxID=1927788 RepID=UPI00200822F8|nr:FAD-binding domain-containing protein [Annulohypoxylon maeteangense]KAI0887005.1 FAD-binding domain-containing protein [Annulohypoxylon maeteangense]